MNTDAERIWVAGVTASASTLRGIGRGGAVQAIRTGLEMSLGERRLRMNRMRLQVKEHNVYRWASSVLADVCAVRIEDEVLARSTRPERRILA